ncbi:uncharacterized protein EDB93DRAFT_1124776 [Suillus bovinus]|uniref:uncharacterized protein n=1 Tax=Suillus bovinus TaxID=48563 RepID=UPI001B8694DA|nr:uncharacterized protein EDB93DRAFT_1124776 [Suillus bovinus]KAG2157808.1 hypothetical protein EDB93DRAFT_1124776 [Suillus bovinus]
MSRYCCNTLFNFILLACRSSSLRIIVKCLLSAYMVCRDTTHENSFWLFTMTSSKFVCRHIFQKYWHLLLLD